MTTSAASNASAPLDERLVLAPSGVRQGASGGVYYWVFVDPSNQTDAVWGAYQRANPTLKVVKSQGDFFVVQNVGSTPVLWTLPGFPSVAPKGAATTSEDVVQAPPPEKNLSDRLYDGFFGDGGFFGQLEFAGQLVLYGAAGVALYTLYRELQKGAPAVSKALTSGRASARSLVTRARSRAS
jgi:hypothetical protein